MAEIRRRGRYVVGPAVGLFILSYFAYHIVHGDRGIHAWNVLDKKATAARAELQQLRAKREVLEHRVNLLDPKSIDRDLLDESVRRVLGYGHPDDIIIYLPDRKQ
ncbi:MAG: septum formation initiator family protein [Rhodospirillales bacterium]|nr:septum formation initiator family protein [Rhodospirillales bacterium]